MNPDVQQNSDGPYYNVAKTPQSRPQTGDKRKSGDDAPEGPPSQRAKRNRYISIAWFVCFCKVSPRIVVANAAVDTAMSANDARSNVMARRPASAVAISPWSASTHQMA